MIKVKQLIKIKHSPVFKIDENDERNCVIAIGKIKDVLFLIRMNDPNNISVKSKKYLKKADLRSVIVELEILKEQEDRENVEVVDLIPKGYTFAQKEIDEKYLEMAEIFKKL